MIARIIWDDITFSITPVLLYRDRVSVKKIWKLIVLPGNFASEALPNYLNIPNKVGRTMIDEQFRFLGPSVNQRWRRRIAGELARELLTAA